MISKVALSNIFTLTMDQMYNVKPSTTFITCLPSSLQLYGAILHLAQPIVLVFRPSNTTLINPCRLLFSAKKL